MQLFALDENSVQVSAEEAEIRVDYRCLECGGQVRLRAGARRQRHFYHAAAYEGCRQGGKTDEHVQTQLFFKKILPDCVLEHRFDEINRIADVLWKNVVFEVQCSPITAAEVEARNRDYEKLGLQVVWILHDRRYNLRKQSGAELFLEERSHYFTNINALGQGKIYDQLTIYKDGIRAFQSPIFLFDITDLRPMQDRLPLLRFKRRPFYFKGDLCDYLLQNAESPLCKAALQLERPERVSWVDWLLLPWRHIFYYLLKKACR